MIKIEHPTSRGGHLPDDPSLRERDGIDEWTWGTLPGPIFRSGIFPDAEPGDQPWNRQGVFNKMNRNKRSLGIDLKLPGGREVFDRLRGGRATSSSTTTAHAACAASASTTSRWPPSTRTSSPCRSPASALPAPTRPASRGARCWRRQSGLAASTGYPDRGPLKMGAALPDPMGGVHGALAVLAALSERDRTGKGMNVDVSQLEAYASIGGEIYLTASLTGRPPERRGNRSLQHAPQGVYPCAGDDAWIAITVASDAEWSALVAEIGDDCTARRGPRLRGRPASSATTNSTRRSAPGRPSTDKFELTRRLQRAGVHRVRVDDEPATSWRTPIWRRGASWWNGTSPRCGVRTYPGFPIHFSGDAQAAPCARVPTSARTTTTC